MIKKCEKEGCNNEFDIDQEGTWVSEAKLENGQLIIHYYCSKEHKP